MDTNELTLWMQDYQDCKCPDNEARCFSDRVFRMMQKHTQLKSLTDAEILEEWDWDSGEILATDLLDFADAILRKAQQ